MSKIIGRQLTDNKTSIDSCFTSEDIYVNNNSVIKYKICTRGIEYTKFSLKVRSVDDVSEISSPRSKLSDASSVLEGVPWSSSLFPLFGMGVDPLSSSLPSYSCKQENNI